MAVTLGDLGKKFLGEVYDIVTGGDGKVSGSPDKFVSWCWPGIPFDPGEFAFCAKGLGGGADAEEEKSLVQQAYNLAEVVDFIPDVAGVHGKGTGEAMFAPSGARLSTMYGEILNASKVVSKALTEEEQKKLERLRGKLVTTKKVKDIVTDEEKEVTVDSPMLVAYQEKMAAFVAAKLLYNAKRVAAQAATGPEGKAAVSDFTNNGTLYALQVKAASDAWVSGGYRNQVNEINAAIDAMTRRSMQLWKASLLERYSNAVLSGLGAGQQFYFTTLVPGNFATAGGWTRFELTHSHVESSSHQVSNAWDVGAGVKFGLLGANANASGESSQFSSSYQVSSFKLSFSLAQVAISRPWFFPELFTNRGWTLRKGEGWNFDQFPSNGETPPKGNFIAYPTMALFAKDITIESQEFAQAVKQQSSSVGGGGSVGWGPLSLKGSYKRGEASQSFEATNDGAKITVPGMQILGFVNHLVGKAPNPLAELKDEDFA